MNDHMGVVKLLCPITERRFDEYARGSRFEVCAPHGLDDLLDGVWRRNPARAGAEISRQRLARHRPAERWPGVRVVT
ncbi:nucleotidyltransferase family protein [Micromonospora sp. NPDC051925]|uniref:nucleotidyltransferase family protein n=1 Tax=Micromonospora sp. NPDC051925 TaxID=3364288 RepID=UPI0037CA17CD